jgi:hypothetical protein
MTDHGAEHRPPSSPARRAALEAALARKFGGERRGAVTAALAKVTSWARPLGTVTEAERELAELTGSPAPSAAPEPSQPVEDAAPPIKEVVAMIDPVEEQLNILEGTIRKEALGAQLEALQVRLERVKTQMSAQAEAQQHIETNARSAAVVRHEVAEIVASSAADPADLARLRRAAETLANGLTTPAFRGQRFVVAASMRRLVEAAHAVGTFSWVDDLEAALERLAGDAFVLGELTEARYRLLVPAEARVIEPPPAPVIHFSPVIQPAEVEIVVVPTAPKKTRTTVTKSANDGMPTETETVAIDK